MTSPSSEPSTTHPNGLSLLYGAVLILAGATALGAAIAAIALVSNLSWGVFLLIIGLGTGLLARYALPQSWRLRTLLAGTCTLLAVGYALLLLAAARIAASLGIGLGSALLNSGTPLLWRVTWMSVHGAILPFALGAAVLAMVLAGWPVNHRPS
ncbi:MAG TPA: hypothetical protein ENI75_02125 [Mizugakiibacter sp.]|nr:hypothetical protein [Mizugakiibacter sp.]